MNSITRFRGRVAKILDDLERRPQPQESFERGYHAGEVDMLDKILRELDGVAEKEADIWSPPAPGIEVLNCGRRWVIRVGNHYVEYRRRGIAVMAHCPFSPVESFDLTTDPAEAQILKAKLFAKWEESGNRGRFLRLWQRVFPPRGFRYSLVQYLQNEADARQ